MPNQCVFVLNCGSSSLKFSVLELHSGEALMHGSAEQLQSPSASVSYSHLGKTTTSPLGDPYSHEAALKCAVSWIAQHPQIYNAITAVGHRVVHGGEMFTQPTVLDRDNIAELKRLSHLAPLHNPANVNGVEAAMIAFPHLPHVGVFDTAFHQTLPEDAYLYALPYELYEKHKIRRYGFHGASHDFVSRRAAHLQGRSLEQSKMVVAHLGNGASVCAIKEGKSVDTSMGFTPLEGLVMGTRCGDIDPSLPMYLSDVLGASTNEVMSLLNKQSGLLGLSERSNDFRVLEKGYTEGDKACQRAIDLYAYRLAKYIASYTVPLGGLDTLIFTGGIGENSILLRKLTSAYLEHLGVVLDETKNQQMSLGGEGVISTGGSVCVMVVPTNEEWMIAKYAATLLS